MGIVCLPIHLAYLVADPQVAATGSSEYPVRVHGSAIWEGPGRIVYQGVQGDGLREEGGSRRGVPEEAVAV